MRAKLCVILLISCCTGPARAQTTSLAKRFARQPSEYRHAESDPRDPNAPQGNPTLERFSLVAVKVTPPRRYKIHDLITIIIREQRKYESDGELQQKKKFDIKSTIDAFFKPINQTLGASTFKYGKPNVDYSFESKLKNEADKDREDRFTTRITAEVVDVKPNGNLILQAKARIKFDDEHSVVTLTGTVRSADVTPDNTVLSTQLADKDIVADNAGAVRDGSRRGWIPRLLDLLRPF